ncbi:substrate-binding domain-containing protein [Laspinema sp. A4]|uniref:PstS family phosphate ABC transporter substrate-binding protein n=1 Tax=Laspinema sp. D2d TaxID=2953686 RepID=UPI0021BB421B|nr:substrate-binding domain-containing protein [Laspinema sp. D2d]MCT7986280.1 substrate-binding domain-containing protein [Laspinema sp. D2d]
MSAKKETTILIIALVIALGLMGASVWWLTKELDGGIRVLTDSENPTPSQGIVNPEGESYPETLAEVQNVPRGLFSHGGSTTWVSIRVAVDPAIQTVWPQFQLRYTDPLRGAPSSGTGIQMLLDNQLTFAMSARPISDGEYQKARDRGFTLKEIPVAIDGIAIVVHPSLPISGITIEQFDGIYAGEITNWNQVGGPDLKIQPYGKIDRDPADSNIILTATTTEALRGVGSNPGGIYWASAPLLVSQCMVKPLPVGRTANNFVAPYKLPFVPVSECPQRRNEVNLDVFRTGEYPWSRRLVVVVKENGQIDQQAGETYAKFLLTEQGQELIRKAGFVSLR